MRGIDRLAELWDRRRALCVCAGAILLGAWAFAHRWLPDGFGAEAFQRTSRIPIVGPVQWNARLRFIAREKEQYLGSVPADADAGNLYGSDPDYHTSFSGGKASLKYGFDRGEIVVDAGNSPILVIARPEKNRIAAGAEDGSIIIWQIVGAPDAPARFKPLATIHTSQPVTALSLCDNATRLTSGSSDGVIRIWDLPEQPRLSREIRDQRKTVYGLAFSPDGSELWSGGFDGVVRVRKLDGDGSVAQQEARSGPIYDLGRLGDFIWDAGYYGVRSPQPTQLVLSYPLPMYQLPMMPRDGKITGTTFGLKWLGSLTWAGKSGTYGPWRISVSPDRRLVAIVVGRSPEKCLSVWQLGQMSFPFGLRYRGQIPDGFPNDQFAWNEDSTALCFHSSTDSRCRWVDAGTGLASNSTGNRRVTSSVLREATITEKGRRIAGKQTLGDRFLGRRITAEIGNAASFIEIGYLRRTFPLGPIELVVLPALAGVLALLLWQNAYWNRKRSFAPAAATLRTFFAAAGAEASINRPGLMRVSQLDAPLAPYAPMPAVIATGPADESHVDLLVERMKLLHSENHRAAGFLFYLEPPTALALLHMAEARLKQLAVIPVPLAPVEKVKESPAEARALLHEYAERYLPGRNLFDDRNAIGDAVAFFGRGSLLAKLEQELLNRQSMGLWGLRKAGKTSILLQLEQILRNRAVVRIGLEPFTVQGAFGNQLFNEILRQLCAALRRLGREASCSQFPVNAPARDSAIEFRGSVEALAAKLGEAGAPPPIVCMLDEMERVLPRDAASAEEFNVTFGALRNLCQDKRVMSVLVTDLFPDSNQVNQWPVAGAGTNPLFNFLKSAYAGPFEKADTVQMIDSLGKLMNFQFAPEELASIHELSGGHAFLARQVAATLYDQRDDGPGRERLLANPIRFSETLRAYFPENVWGPLEARGDTAALAILTALADANDWAPGTEVQARCPQPKTVFWSAIEWLAQTGVIETRSAGKPDESYRIRIGMFAQWFHQSEVSVRKNV